MRCILQALIAVNNLLQLKTTEALDFKDYCDLDGALERMRKQLQQLMEDEYQRDYLMDLESLRREVELVFHQKLVKVRDINFSWFHSDCKFDCSHLTKTIEVAGDKCSNMMMI